MEDKRTKPDRRATGRRLDERRKYGFGEIIPERRVSARRVGSRREGPRREAPKPGEAKPE